MLSLECHIFTRSNSAAVEKEVALRLQIGLSLVIVARAFLRRQHEPDVPRVNIQNKRLLSRTHTHIYITTNSHAPPMFPRLKAAALFLEKAALLDALHLSRGRLRAHAQHNVSVNDSN